MPEQSLLQPASGEGDGDPPEDKSESDVEASDVESASGFRVSVDLSAYWSAPAACLVWVPRAAGCVRRVRWLARRVRRAAQLRRPFCLLCGARALPPAEPLRMLRSGDQLRVVPVEHEWQQAFSFPADASLPDPVALLEPTKKKHRSSKLEPEGLVTGASSEPIRKHKSSRVTPQPALALSESTKKQRGSEAESASESPEVREAKQKRRKRNTLTEASPPYVFETEMQTDSVPPAECVDTGSDAALERVKRRALALLQQVAGDEEPAAGALVQRVSCGSEPAASTLVEQAGPGGPARRRRRRVRRRRAPPAAPEPDPADASAPSPVRAESCSSPAPRDPSPAVLRDPSPGVLRDPSPGALRDPSSEVLRNPTPPRPPRLVRPLPAASADDLHNTSEPERAASPRAAPRAVQCN